MDETVDQTVEQRLAAVEARAERIERANAQLYRTLGLVADVLERSVAELATAES